MKTTNLCPSITSNTTIVKYIFYVQERFNREDTYYELKIK